MMTETPPEAAERGPTNDKSHDGTDKASAEGATNRPNEPVAEKWPVKRYHAGRGQHVGNTMMSALTRWGLVPHSYVMTTTGRKTGTARSNPVTLVEKGDNRWLVAPYGPVPWVLNARAAGRVTLSRRGHTQDYGIAELPAEQAGPILKDYVKIASATRTFFEATKASPVADFVAEASRHPVFALTPVPDRHATD